MGKITFDDVKKRHDTAIQLLNNFESTISGISAAAQPFASEMIKLIRQKCKLFLDSCQPTPNPLEEIFKTTSSSAVIQKMEE